MAPILKRNGKLALDVPVEAVLSALSGQQRFEIIQHLSRTPMAVSEIANALELGVVTVSQNLSHLKQCGLVTMRKHGVRHVYRLHERVRVRRRQSRVSIAVRGQKGKLLLLSYCIDEDGLVQRV